MYKILIMEDEQAIANLIYENLSDEGYRCYCAFDRKQGADLIEKENYDLILLDITLPEIDGYELLEYLIPLEIPVIFLTAKGTANDRTQGLKLDADDYLEKPFEIGELLARVEAVLQRHGKRDKLLAFADVSINIDSRQVVQNGQIIKLTVKELGLLVELVRNKNVSMHRTKLYENVWGVKSIGAARAVDSHIKRLRKKLGWEKRIITAFRIGYRLEG